LLVNSKSNTSLRKERKVSYRRQLERDNFQVMGVHEESEQRERSCPACIPHAPSTSQKFSTQHSEIITKASWRLFWGTMKLTVYFAIFTTSLQGLFVAAAELDLADEQARSKTLEGGGRNVLGLSVSQRRELHHYWSWPFDEVQP
jgi:hypothetical protein